MISSLSLSVKQRFQTEALFRSPHLISMVFLGFASGLPLFLTGSTLQAWYTVCGVNLVTIGMLTLVGQPYVYKFLWAPLLDRFTLTKGQRRRSWLLLLQILLIIGIGVMGAFNPAKRPVTLAFLALIIAFFSATQDIVIDAYRTEILTVEKRGLGLALSTIGYRIALLVTGAIALVMADRIGWKLTYWIMALLMGLELIVTYFLKEEAATNAHPQSLSTAMIQPFLSLLYQKQIGIILLFIVLYKLGDVFTLTLGTTFLIRSIGFSLTDIGLTYKLVGMIGLLFGAVVGGLAMKKIKLFPALVLFGIIQALANLPFLALAMIGKNYSLLILTVFIENFGSGLGSVAFLAFIMSLCDKHYTATHFAVFTALAAIGRVFAGPLAAIVVEQVGWVQYYLWAFLMGFPGIVMLVFLKKHWIFNSPPSRCSRIESQKSAVPVE